MIYANSHNTEIRARLGLRSTVRGANNRLDVDSIVSFDKADGVSTPVLGKPLVMLGCVGTCTVPLMSRICVPAVCGC